MSFLAIGCLVFALAWPVLAPGTADVLAAGAADVLSAEAADVVAAESAAVRTADAAIAPGSPPPNRAPPVGLEVVPATAPEILAAAKSSKSRAVVVNLWATWCTPCREEFPDLMRFHNAFKDRGVSLVLVSGDFSSDTEAAREFLASQGVDFRTYLKSGSDEELINSFDPAWSGALPATFVYNDRGERVHSFLGTVTYDSLEREISPLLAAKPN